MENIKLIYKRKRKVVKFEETSERPLVILSEKNNEYLEKIKKMFPTHDFDFIIGNQNLNKINKSISEYKPLFVITDSRLIQRKVNSCDSYLIKQKELNKDTIILHDEMLDKTKIKPMFSGNVEFSSKDINIFDFIKKTKLKTNKIISIKNNSVIIAYKVEGSWRIMEKNDILIHYFAKIKSKFSNNSDGSSPTYLEEFSNRNEDILANNFDLDISEKFYKTETYFNLINWLISDEFYVDLNIQSKFKSFRYGSQIVNLKPKNGYNDLIKKIKENEEIDGVPIMSWKETDNYIQLKVKFGLINICLDNSNSSVAIVSYNMAADEDEVDLKIFKDGIISNITNYINFNVVQNKISKKNIFRALLGVILLISLTYVTFTWVFNFSSVKEAFEISFNKESLMMPWIYFIILSFMFSLFMPIIIALFMETAIFRRKPDIKRLLIYYESSLVRKAFMLVTGNYFLSLFVWGWYMNRRTKVKTSSLVAAIASTSIIRGIFYSIIGSILMFVGTGSFFISYGGKFDLSVIVTFVISWLGFLWANFTHFWIFIIILSPTFHSIVDKFIIKYKFKNKRITKEYLEESYFSSFLVQRGNLTKEIWKNKRLVTRTLLFILVPIVVEGIETILYFNMIDSLVLKETGFYSSNFSLYYNWISISGIRLVASNIRNFPLLNIIPANGIGVTEVALNTLYSTIYTHKHIDNLNVWGDYTSNDMAQMTTVMTRFFNTYLQTIITLLFTMVIIILEIFKRKYNKNKGLK